VALRPQLFAGFAFIAIPILNFQNAPSILGCAYVRVGLSTGGRTPALGQLVLLRFSGHFHFGLY